jgi:hypothetical protein
VLTTVPYIIGKTDVRWDNPRLIPQNNSLNVLGCNVYRATDSPEGAYVLCNTTPVTALFYRDETVEEVVYQEDATATLIPGTDPDAKWIVYSAHKPIVIPNSNGKYSDNIKDVVVEIDNGDATFLEIPAFYLDGVTGKITLISLPTFNYDVDQIIPPRLPTPPNGHVRISYRYLKHSVLSELNQRIYYKVTTVATDPTNPAANIETPLSEVEAFSAFDIEPLDYIWAEAIRRNRYILEQGGERVKIFVRKWMGEVCDTYNYAYGQSHNDCTQCMGVGILGGYIGPYEAIIAPPEAEKTIELTDIGLHVNFQFQTWTGPYPLLNQRDFIVRQNNHRFVVGPVNAQGQRGAIFQQHFTISQLDEGDIRYKVPITGGEITVPESTDLYRDPQLKSPASPVINDKPGIDPDKQQRGRTVTWENITWVFVLALIKFSMLSCSIWNQIV